MPSKLQIAFFANGFARSAMKRLGLLVVLLVALGRTSSATPIVTYAVPVDLEPTFTLSLDFGTGDVRITGFLGTLTGKFDPSGIEFPNLPNSVGGQVGNAG